MEAGDYNIQSCSTAPYRCVVANCNELLCSSTVLSHFLSIHQKNNVEFQAVDVNEKILMVVSTHESFLQLNQNVCLGVLGVQLNKSDHSNAMLKDEFKIFSHHIPVLIMACRGNYGEKYASRNYDSSSDFVCFWLITPQLKSARRLHAIITIHDEDLNNSLSSSMDTRRIDSTQRVDEFMHNETNFLIVNAGMLHNITIEDSLFLEIIFKDKLL
jgi:Domain of unknown function (DUF4729)